MNHQQLQNLIEIGKHKSMSEASEVLHLTPQALSASIKALEKDLGLKLLQTTFRGSTLTSKGEQVSQLAQKFLADLEALKADQPVKSAQPLLLPGLPGVINWYLEPLYDYIQQKFPSLTVDFKALPISALIDKIQQGELPYGFIYQPFLNGTSTMQYDDLVFTAIKHRPSVLLAHKDHPLARYKSVSLTTAFKYPMAMMEGTDCMIQELFALYGKPPKIHFVPSASVFRPLLENNAATLMAYDAYPYLNTQNVVQIELKPKLSAAFGLVKRADHILTAHQEYDVAFLTEFFQSHFEDAHIL